MNKSHSDITLEVDLGAIIYNYKILQNLASPAITASVVKANAYGLGVEKVAPALYSAGCRDFFVATLDEALQLTKILGPDANCAVFHGVKRGEETLFSENNIIPVINDIYQLELWHHRAKVEGLELPAILHFDTGMNRLGFNWQDAKQISESSLLKNLDIRFLMSHLSSAEDPANPLNNEQLKRINEVRKYFPKTPVSLSNSWGVLSDKCYHFDMTRPGCALYGVKGNSKANIKHVITAKAKIIQLREMAEDGFVGYGASQNVKKGARLAVAPLGYADGYLRSLSNKSYAFFNGKKLPLVGRVSMDLSIFDISAVPANEIKPGDEIEMIGNHYTVDEVAANAGTIGYEILTSLGGRYKRVYK